VVTGLPVEYLRRDSKRLKEMIRGVHEITYHNFNGQDETRKITIDKLCIIPQPIGSIFNLIFDDQGKIKDKQLTRQKLGVVDIGFKTTDLSIFDRLQYVERGSSTLDAGISKCFSVISDKLKRESNINLELYRIFKFIESGKIKIRGKEYNISNLKKKVYSQAASAIASNLNHLWENDWDIDSIILSGGGSIELAEYLAANIKGNVIPVQRNIDPRFNNVLGYCKFGQYKWGPEPAAAAKESIVTPPVSTSADSKENEREYIPVTREPEPPVEKASKTIGWLKR
jgi:plasmid segregation protein ParM